MIEIAGCRARDGAKAKGVFLRLLWWKCNECLYYTVAVMGNVPERRLWLPAALQTAHFQSQWRPFWQHPSKKFSSKYWREIVFQVRMMHLRVYTHIPMSRLCDKKKKCSRQRFVWELECLTKLKSCNDIFWEDKEFRGTTASVNSSLCSCKSFLFLRNNFLLRWPDFPYQPFSKCFFPPCAACILIGHVCWAVGGPQSFPQLLSFILPSILSLCVYVFPLSGCPPLPWLCSPN